MTPFRAPYEIAARLTVHIVGTATPRNHSGRERVFECVRCAAGEQGNVFCDDVVTPNPPEMNATGDSVGTSLNVIA
jgi:hypothetical protein